VGGPLIILNCLFLDDIFIFPREKNTKLGHAEVTESILPPVADIQSTLKKAKLDAAQDAKQLGINLNFDEEKAALEQPSITQVKNDNVDCTNLEVH